MEIKDAIEFMKEKHKKDRCEIKEHHIIHIL